MSKTYSIACKDCKKHLWIGQGRHSEIPEEQHIYTGMSNVMKELELFLFSHQGHGLVFDENCESEIGDYEEIEPEN